MTSLSSCGMTGILLSFSGLDHLTRLFALSYLFLLLPSTFAGSAYFACLTTHSFFVTFYMFLTSFSSDCDGVFLNPFGSHPVPISHDKTVFVHPLSILCPHPHLEFWDYPLPRSFRRLDSRGHSLSAPSFFLLTCVEFVVSSQGVEVFISFPFPFFRPPLSPVP